MELITIGSCEIEATCKDGMPYANFRRLCEDLGISYSRQLIKLKSARWAGVAMMTTPDKRGRPQEQAFISADSIPMWLATINANKVANDVRATLNVIQDEAKDALYRHFLGTAVFPSDEIRMIKADVSELQRQYIGVFNRIVDMQEQQHKQTDAMMVLLKRIDERTENKREHFSLEVKRAYVACVDARYSGSCPCCQQIKITKGGKKIKYTAEFEHYHGRSFNKKEHGWLVCKSCNSKLRNKKPGGFWFESSTAFQHFQRMLHSNNQLELKFEV